MSVTLAPGGMPPIQRILAVVAHPDDESFALGSILSALVAQGTAVSVLCFTHGERSTLGRENADLALVRPVELYAAAQVLGLDHVTLLSYPDGQLDEISLDELADRVLGLASGADALLVFDEGGVTGHSDHCAATDAARVAGGILDLPIYAWALPQSVALRLNDEFGTSFVGRGKNRLDIVLEIDRTLQLEAIACHRSQSTGNPVLWRRLALLGTREWLSCLRPMEHKVLPTGTGTCATGPAVL